MSYGAMLIEPWCCWLWPFCVSLRIKLSTSLITLSSLEPHISNCRCGSGSLLSRTPPARDAKVHAYNCHRPISLFFVKKDRFSEKVGLSFVKHTTLSAASWSEYYHPKIDFWTFILKTWFSFPFQNIKLVVAGVAACLTYLVIQTELTPWNKTYGISWNTESYRCVHREVKHIKRYEIKVL